MSLPFVSRDELSRVALDLQRIGEVDRLQAEVALLRERVAELTCVLRDVSAYAEWCERVSQRVPNSEIRSDLRALVGDVLGAGLESFERQARGLRR